MITTVGKVRDKSGLDANSGILDEQIITFIQDAQKVVRRDAFIHEEMIQPSPHPKTALLWDGSNTRFQTKYPLCDHDFDRTTSDDVEGIWIDADFEVQTCSITVNNAKFGLVDIYQSNGSTPIPATAENVLIDYYWNDELIPFDVLEDMGTALVCHELQNRLTEPRQIDITDIENNKKLLFLTNNNWKYAYKELVARYAASLMGGT
ncbi:MAG: hypothetical protein KAS32_13990 [Candidatus Peribacteraceae bacterium]|nr:hypothetical protein [Candidatus Peribacteraceae bacterium]